MALDDPWFHGLQSVGSGEPYYAPKELTMNRTRHEEFEFPYITSYGREWRIIRCHIKYHDEGKEARTTAGPFDTFEAAKLAFTVMYL